MPEALAPTKKKKNFRNKMSALEMVSTPVMGAKEIGIIGPV